MYDKAFFIEKYKDFKKQNAGQIPKRREFEKFAVVPKYALEKAFGQNCFSKLQVECGDDANKLKLVRMSETEIFEQWGNLAQKHGRMPTQADWLEAGCKPTPSGLSQPPHNIKWSDLAVKFLTYARDIEKWQSLISLIEDAKSILKVEKPKRDEFDKLCDFILTWTPDRKRSSEESYKIELRNYLAQNGHEVQEESGETRSDLVVKGRFSIELKKDPSSSEYDRLLGQMVRHGLSFGAVIAVIVDASSLDRFEKFSRTVDLIFPKIEINAKVLRR